MNGLGYSVWSNPWQRLREMERQVDRLFGGQPGERFAPRGAGFPPLNVHADAEEATVTAELPGVDPKELDISVHNRLLTLRGDRRAPETSDNETWHRRERVFGRFSRSLELPFAVDPDDVEATYDDGVLTVRLQRSEMDKPRKITVQN